MKILFLMMLLVAITASHATAQETESSSPRDGFYTVKEQLLYSQKSTSTMDPLEIAENIWEEANEGLSELSVGLYSLVDFDFHNERYGNVSEPYKRQTHFGGWVDDQRDEDCYNTRAKVLIRDSLVAVRFNSSGCSVASGKWADPYGGRDYTRASDIQIDHFVPLKNAYISGAYKWNREKRCLYANYLGNPFHLLPVYGRENSAKGDKTPEGYMPPNRSYQCDYVAQWLKVKLIWSLGLTSTEKTTVLDLIKNNHCSSTEMTFTAQELVEQRRFIADNMNLCQ